LYYVLSREEVTNHSGQMLDVKKKSCELQTKHNQACLNMLI